MHNDIAFGQYCEGHSVLHRMDPRMKLLLAILYIVVIFLAKSASAFLLLTALGPLGRLDLPDLGDFQGVWRE